MKTPLYLRKPEDALTDCIAAVTDFCSFFEEEVSQNEDVDYRLMRVDYSLDDLQDDGFTLHDVIYAIDVILDDEDLQAEIGTDSMFLALGYLNIRAGWFLTGKQAYEDNQCIEAKIQHETMFLRSLVTPGQHNVRIFIRAPEMKGRAVLSVGMSGQKYHVVCMTPRDGMKIVYRFLRFKNRTVKPNDLTNGRKMFESVIAQPHSDGILWLRPVARRLMSVPGEDARFARYYNVIL